MGEILRFLIETTKGFMLAASIPLLIYAVYICVKAGGVIGFNDKMSAIDRRRNEVRRTNREDGAYTDDEWRRTHTPQPSKYKGGKWFGPLPVVAQGFHDIVKFSKKAEKISIPVLLRLQIASGAFLYLFVGHASCILLAWAQTHGGRELVSGLITLNPSFQQWHLTLATAYAFIELILSVWSYVIELVESAVTVMLTKIRDFLCFELGKERGIEAARFLALLMDVYFDKKDVRTVKKMAWMQRGLSGREFTMAFVAIYEDKTHSSRISHLIPLTAEGKALYQDIQEIL